MQTAASSVVPRLYVNNRRDGARLLSIAMIVAVSALVRADHPLGLGVGAAATGMSVYWWCLYRRLPERGQGSA